MLSCFSFVWLFAVPWTAACQSLLWIFQAEHCNGLPCPPGNLLDPEIKPMSPVSLVYQVDSLPTEPPGKPIFIKTYVHINCLLAQTVKNLPAMWETWTWSQGWEDPLEKRMSTHSSILTPAKIWTQLSD